MPMHQPTPAADNQGMVRVCSVCGRKNRLLYARLDRPARCGDCGTALPAPAESVAIDRGGDLTTLLKSAALPVLVDFWAPWCGPCRSMAPEVEKVAASQAGQLLVVKSNTDADPTIGATHRISSIPTLALFSSGREVARTSGARPATAITSFVRQALGGASPRQ